MVSLQSKLETLICVALLLSKNGKVLTVTYLYVLSRFSSQFLEQLLAEPIPMLQQPKTLAACALNCAVYLADRYNKNNSYFKAIYNKEQSKTTHLEPIFTSKMDTFVIFHVVGSIQRQLILQSSLRSNTVKISDLQQLAVQLSAEIDDKMEHIFNTDETLTAEWAYTEFLFWTIFDLGVRLAKSKERLDLLSKVYGQFKLILKPIAIDQVTV